jgi:hypothetical protein
MKLSLLFTRLGRRYFFLALFLGFLLGCRDSYSSKDSTQYVRVFFDNPRNISDSRGYGGQIILLIENDSHELSAPKVIVDYPKKGLTGIYYEKEQQAPLLGAGDDTRIGIPIGPNIHKYIFLINGLSENTGWRYFEIEKDDQLLKLHDKIHFPDLLTLEPLSDRKNNKELWDTYQNALLEYENSQK